MWYFPWVLGLGLAAIAGVLNARWYEMRTVRVQETAKATLLPTP